MSTISEASSDISQRNNWVLFRDIGESGPVSGEAESGVEPSE